MTRERGQALLPRCAIVKGANAVMTDLRSTSSSVPLPTSLPPIIQVEDVTVVLGGRSIYQHVQLSIQPGEFLAILGPNGAGKSTLLKAILGLIPLAAGKITVLGHPA